MGAPLCQIARSLPVFQLTPPYGGDSGVIQYLTLKSKKTLFRESIKCRQKNEEKFYDTMLSNIPVHGLLPFRDHTGENKIT